MPALIPDDLGLWSALGAAMLLLPCVLVLPLRGGHGEHAHSGPGTLTVAHLTSEPHQPVPTPPRPRRPTRPTGTPEPPCDAETAPEDDEPVEELTRPPEQPSPGTEAVHAPRLRRASGEPSAVEQELAALLHLFPDLDHPGPEPGYTGRHRLPEPDGFGAPPMLREATFPRPVAA